MAKKSGRQSVNNKHIKSERIVHFLYENGFLQSTIVHTIVLLIMALIVIKEVEKKPIKLSLSFSPVSDQESVSFDKVLEFTNIEPPDDATESLEKENNNHISETLVSTNIPIEDSIENIELNETKTNHLFIDELKLSDINTKVKLNESITHHATNTSNTDEGVLKELSKVLSRGSSSQDNNSFGNNGILQDIGNRLSAAGAKTGDIQISIAWNTIDDIDLHVAVRVNGQVSIISWNNRIGINGGMLDVDMNASFGQLVNKPVENVFWPKNAAPHGEYSIGVHHFRNWSMSKQVPVIIILKIDGKIETYNVIVSSTRPMIEVARFKR